LPTFNLITQPWIPVRTRANRLEDERIERVSITEALLNPRAYLRIADSSPLVTAATYRLLLAVLHRALEGPDAPAVTAQWFRDGFPSAPIKEYLELWTPRFDLFDPNKPFYQLPHLPLGAFTDHWTRLSAERGSGNTSFLFNHRLRDNAPDPSDPITPAEAAGRLLEHQTFALGGLMKRFVTAAPSAPVSSAAFVIPHGADLLETLCLNLVPYPVSRRERDQPIWEREPYTVQQLEAGRSEPILGITSRYTWFTRSVRLEPEMEEGECRVRFMAYAAGVAVNGGEAQNDPMVAYVPPLKEGQEFRPLGFREGRGLWREFHALLPQPQGARKTIPVIENARALLGKSKRQVQAFVFGQGNDKGKMLMARGEAFRLPEVALRDVSVYQFIKQRLDGAETTEFALRNAVRLMAEKLLSVGERKPFTEDVSKLADGMPHRLHYWSNLELAFNRFLSELPSDLERFDELRDDLERGWNQTLTNTAWRAFSLAEISAGDDAHALKAVASARGFFTASLNKQFPRSTGGES
jgi:CRISPR system Cascade subunit CasA